MFEKKCTQGGNHHKFTARGHNKSYLPKVFLDRISRMEGAVDIEPYKSTEFEYLKDVCEWCGKEIQR